LLNLRPKKAEHADASAAFPGSRVNSNLYSAGESLDSGAKKQMETNEGSRPASAEQWRKELGITLPAPPEPFGVYAEAVQTGSLIFLTGMMPTQGRSAKFIGRVGAELDVEAGSNAALNALAVARKYLGSLEKVTRVFRLGVSVATVGATALRNCCETSSEETSVPPGVWCRQPSARRARRAGSDFRGGNVREV
jgi:hypothetical protein